MMRILLYIFLFWLILTPFSQADSICVDCEPLAQEIHTSVTGFGATGDGVTDDQAAIQSAIDSLPASGGTVYFPPGTYKINTPIICNTEDVKLIGNGLNVTILLGSTSQHGIRITADRCEIKDITIDPPASYAKSAIRIEDSVNNTLIKRVRITGNDYTAGSKGIEFITSTANGITFNIVKDSRIENLERQIDLNAAVAGSWVNGNNFIDNTFFNPGTAGYMSNSGLGTSGNVFVSNQIQTNASLIEGFRVDGDWNMFVGNRFWDLNVSGNQGLNILATASFTQWSGGYLLSSDITDNGTSSQIVQGDLNKFASRILAPEGTCSAPTYSFEGHTTMGMGEFGDSLALCRAGTTEWLIRAADLVPPTDGANNVGSAGLGIGEIHVYELFLKPQSSPPTSPSLGAMYADSDTNELCFYDGTNWQGISTGTDANCS